MGEREIEVGAENTSPYTRKNAHHGYVMFKTRTAVFYQVEQFEGVARAFLNLIKHVITMLFSHYNNVVQP